MCSTPSIQCSEFELSRCSELCEALPPAIKTIIPQVQDMFTLRKDPRMGEMRVSNFGPNCFWFALAYADNRFLSLPRGLGEDEFLAELLQHFHPVQPEKVLPGDVVVFWGSISSDMPGPVHAALWLAPNLLFQKNNPYDQNFSFTSFSEQLANWEERALQLYQGSPDISVTYYRFME